MTAYTLIVSVHVLLGSVALVTFWLAAAFRKGSPRHRRVGQVYLLAMVGILATGIPLMLQRFMTDREAQGAFLGFLLLLTATTVWTSWRSIEDKYDLARYTGRIYRGFAIANLVGAGIVMVLGVHYGHALLIGFPLLGVFAGIDMLRKPARLARQPRWWVVEHYTSMLGNGVATHIAFLAIGLPRLLPQVDGDALHYLAWFGPVGGLLLAKAVLDRRWKAPLRPVAGPAAHATVDAPAASAPSH